MSQLGNVVLEGILKEIAAIQQNLYIRLDHVRAQLKEKQFNKKKKSLKKEKLYLEKKVETLDKIKKKLSKNERLSLKEKATLRKL